MSAPFPLVTHIRGIVVGDPSDCVAFAAFLSATRRARLIPCHGQHFALSRVGWASRIIVRELFAPGRGEGVGMADVGMEVLRRKLDTLGHTLQGALGASLNVLAIRHGFSLRNGPAKSPSHVDP